MEDQVRREFPNMRAARSTILKEIERAARRPDSLVVQMIGGRIRSMSEIARTAINNLATMPDRKGDVELRIQCLCPTYLETLTSPGDLEDRDQAPRNAAYAQHIKFESTELANLCASLHGGKSPSCTVRMSHYASAPVLYCYVIGKRAIVWGFFTWKKDQSDFEGPQNPCLLVRKTDPGFNATRDWLLNRAKYNTAEAALLGYCSS